MLVFFLCCGFLSLIYEISNYSTVLADRSVPNLYSCIYLEVCLFRNEACIVGKEQFKDSLQSDKGKIFSLPIYISTYM